MQSKSLMLKAAVTSALVALLGSGAGFAATPDVGVTAADAPLEAVTDDEQLNEMVDANDVDHGAKDDVDQGAEHDVDNHAMNDINEDANNDVESDVKESAADAMNAQQDAVEATQEHENESGGNSGPSG